VNEKARTVLLNIGVLGYLPIARDACPRFQSTFVCSLGGGFDTLGDHFFMLELSPCTLNRAEPELVSAQPKLNMCNIEDDLNIFLSVLKMGGATAEALTKEPIGQVTKISTKSCCHMLLSAYLPPFRPKGCQLQELAKLDFILAYHRIAL